ncbi:ABC transporter ATP-binding protein [Brevibacillus fluminis]|uniref:ABC transporter ATP-binding protein n=1 Tax=Brevibacillus fluminis TaxID=511487 RepID=UPI003F8B5777
MSNEYAMELRHVTKIINGKRIVDNVSFTVNKGEVLGLLGPNGAGKTTTMRMMVGLSGLTEGDVLIEGHSIKQSYSQAISHVGAIIENPDLYPFLSGYQNLLHYANMMPGGVPARDIYAIVEQVQLSERIHDKVGTYSLGMRQRLGLAQALLHKPSVLILDEPTNGLDPKGIHELRTYLRMLAKEQDVAVLISSHQLAEMQLICDRVAIMQHGRLIDVASVHAADTEESQQRVVHFTVEPLEQVQQLFRDELPDMAPQWKLDGFTLTLRRDHIPALVARLAANGINIFEVHAEQQSLEAIYLEVTKGVAHQ